MARGLDAGKYFWRSGREKCFSLDIPFNRTSGQCAGVGPGMIFWVAVFRQVDFSGIALHYATLRE
jgi:hypothetical protein